MLYLTEVDKTRAELKVNITLLTWENIMNVVVGSPQPQSRFLGANETEDRPAFWAGEQGGPKGEAAAWVCGVDSMKTKQRPVTRRRNRPRRLEDCESRVSFRVALSRRVENVPSCFWAEAGGYGDERKLRQQAAVTSRELEVFWDDGRTASGASCTLVGGTVCGSKAYPWELQKSFVPWHTQFD